MEISFDNIAQLCTRFHLKLKAQYFVVAARIFIWNILIIIFRVAFLVKTELLQMIQCH